MTYKNPRYVNSVGGIILMQSNGIEIYVSADSELHRRAANGDFGEVGMYQPPAPPTDAQILAAERATMVCSPMQGILTLGETEWAKVLEYRDTTATWQEKVIIDSALDWKRNSQNIAFFQYLLGYTEEQVDNLFRTAIQVEA